MIIGAMRAEEAKVFSDDAGYHSFVDKQGTEYGSFEVFWDDATIGEWSEAAGIPGGDGAAIRSGWYWWVCFPGCLPDGEPMGPFSTSYRAYADARDED